MEKLQNSVQVMRKELQNLRRQVKQLEHMLKTEIQSLRTRLLQTSSVPEKPAVVSAVRSSQPTLISLLSEAAIGTVQTCFREKNGTPRQPGLVGSARGSIRVEGFTNPHHSLEGLEEYSHVWLLFVFHLNEHASSIKAKVKPPRLTGEKRGVFATRSPHRPCPIGLSLVKMDKIEGNTLYVSGVDLVDGTPILDIKPYIPSYDNPIAQLKFNKECGKVIPGQLEPSPIRVAPWLDSPSSSLLNVEFTWSAERQLSLFHCKPKLPTMAKDQYTEHKSELEGKLYEEGIDRYNPDSTGKEYKHPSLQHFSSVSEARQAITEVLQQDPRSVYRREKCSHELYKFSIDNLNVTCEFTEGEKVRVIDIQSKEKWTYKRSTGKKMDCNSGVLG